MTRASPAMRTIFAFFLLGALPGLARAEVARYMIDPDHKTVAFMIEHMGYAKTLGLFRDVSASYSFDDATGEVSDVSVIVKTASVDTAHAKRDEHLRNKDFLNVERFPEMLFYATSARPVGDGRYRIDGELEMLGRKAPLTLEATVNKRAEYPAVVPMPKRPYVMGISARGRFNRSAFGMDTYVANGLIGDEVELIIEFEARKQE